MLQYFGYSEISKFDQSFMSKEHILSFEVSMNDFPNLFEIYLLWIYLIAIHKCKNH